jgi:ABC-type transporter Mla maintaining outer membrane lipid asymmetry ATPase subunit MlaF
MSTVLILGSSGTGKSTSFRTLDPKSTFIINVLSKPLPFRGGAKLYNDEQKNYAETDRASTIVKYIEAINQRRPEITTLIIDDITFVMNNEYMRRCQEKHFTKFVDMGANMFGIMDACAATRPDLICYLTSHTEVGMDGMIIPRTVGRMTNDYVGLGERVTVSLHSRVIDGEY